MTPPPSPPFGSFPKIRKFIESGRDSLPLVKENFLTHNGGGIMVWQIITIRGKKRKRWRRLTSHRWTLFLVPGLAAPWGCDQPRIKILTWKDFSLNDLISDNMYAKYCKYKWSACQTFYLLFCKKGFTCKLTLSCLIICRPSNKQSNDQEICVQRICFGYKHQPISLVLWRLKVYLQKKVCP